MKEIKLIPILVFSASLSLFTAQVARAEGCSDYPYAPMQTKFVPKADGTFSLQMTQEASVRADSQRQKSRALKIAQLRAEQAVSKFIKQELEGKDSFSNEAIEDSVENADGVDWKVEEAQTFIESVAASSKNLIRGIIPIGSCYEPGKYVRVTVGIKPETMTAAGNTGATSNKPYSGYDTKTKSPTPSSNDVTSSPVRKMQPFNTAPGYSGIDPDF
tara:strand:- start:5536 stop:6183 length:648 start_codon:yes stop_codon:yes gene_type:complete